MDYSYRIAATSQVKGGAAGAALAGTCGYSGWPLLMS
jgi:hypothetical protein